MNYNELTRRHFEDPRSAGVLSGPGVRRAAAGSRARGTWVQFDIDIEAATASSPARIVAARFQAFGCPHVIAACDWLATTSLGREPGAARGVSVAVLERTFAVPVDKRGRLMVVEDAWNAVLAPPLTDPGPRSAP